jgi:hypothetical protein
MGIFKQRKTDLTAGSDIPLDQVVAMKSQGYSNNQIIQTLQRDGYTSSQIFDAISQSEMTSSNPGMGPGMNQMNQMNQPNDPSMQLDPSTAIAPTGQDPYIPMQQMPQQNYGGSSSEEMIEAIIDEKWNELVRDINKVIEWKIRADARLSSVEQQMNDLKEQFDKLHSAILGKIGEYDKNMLDVGAELQAMEKVFSKVLPQFVDNVNELSRITDKVKSNSQSAPKTKNLAKIAKDEEE